MGTPLWTPCGPAYDSVLWFYCFMFGMPIFFGGIRPWFKA